MRCYLSKGVVLCRTAIHFNLTKSHVLQVEKETNNIKNKRRTNLSRAEAIKPLTLLPPKFP